MKPLRALGFVLSGEPGRDGALSAIHWLTGHELWSHALDLVAFFVPASLLVASFDAVSGLGLVSMSSDCRGASFYILMISIFAYCRNSPQRIPFLAIHPHFHPSQFPPGR